MTSSPYYLPITRTRSAALLVLLQFTYAAVEDGTNIRIGLQFFVEQPEDGAQAQYDCIEPDQYIKLGQPNKNTARLQLCSSQDVRKPFNPLQLDSDCWHRCSSADILSSQATEWVIEIIRTVIQQLQKDVHILWPVEEIQISGFAEDTSASSSDPEEEDPPICPAIPLPLTVAVPNSRLLTSNPDQGDLQVYITFRPNPSAARGATTVCKRDGFGRPVVVHVNLHAPFVATMHAISTRRVLRAARYSAAEAERLISVVVRHEMMHALALTSTSIQQFRTLSRKLRGSVVEDTDARGDEAQFLVTPNAKFAVRQQYNILDPVILPSDVPGLEIVGYSELSAGPEQELPPASEVHLSPQVARSDISSTSPDEYAVMSIFSHAVLNDTGWYKAVGEPQPLLWGVGRNRAFIELPPTRNNTAASAYDCDAASVVDGQPVAKALACSYDPDFKGFCVEPEEVPGIQAWTMSHYVEPRRDLGSCKNGSYNAFFNATNTLQEQFGDDSRCFMVREGNDLNAVCLRFSCVNGGVNVTLGNNPQPITCPFNQEVSVAVTAAGSLETEVIGLVCPSKQETCPEAKELPCPRGCSMPNGNCDTITQTCVCNDGWGGVDCSEYMCSGNSCLPDMSQEFEEAHGTCQDGACECDEGFTGIDCRVEEPQCTRDCALLGEGYHCVGETCERQCSTGGDACVDVTDVQKDFEDCDDSFAWADTTHVCIPTGEMSTQFSGLKLRYQRELQRWRPNQDTQLSQTPRCQETVERLACFTVFRECNIETDIEWPLCMELCQAYARNCGESPVRPCEEPLFRAESNSKLCSGSADPNDFLSWSQIFGIIFGSIVAFLLLLLVLMLWLFRCWPCRSRADPPPPQPALAMDATDAIPAEGGAPTNNVLHASGNMLHPETRSREDVTRMCTLLRRPRRRSQMASHSTANASAATRLSAAGGRSQTPPFTSRAPSSVDPGQSGGSSTLRTGGTMSHALGTAEQPELSSTSHYAMSRPASVSHRSQPSHYGEAEESVSATPTSQHNGPGENLASSYGTHTTLPQFFQPSAFSTADDPVWAHSSWQQHEALHSGLPPTYPHGRKVSGASSGDGLPAGMAGTQSGRTPSRSPTPLSGSPYGSMIMSQPSGQNSSGPPPETGPEAGQHTPSSILNAISGSTMVSKGKSKGRLPGARMLKRPARRRLDSTGMAPSAPGETEARSDGPSSPTCSRSHEARSLSGERSPLQNVSTNLEGDLSTVTALSPHTSGTANGAILTHPSQADAGYASGRASSRRSGETSPQRSIRDSDGLPPKPQVMPLSSAAALLQVAAGHATVVPPYVTEPPVPPLPGSDGHEMVEMVPVHRPMPTSPSPTMRWQQEEEEESQDPFLDDSPMLEVLGDTTAGLSLEPPSQQTPIYGLSRDNGPGSITLQLPSFHNSKSMRLHANSPQHLPASSMSFRHAVESSAGVASFHSDATTSGVVPVATGGLERRQSDPFLADPAPIDEGMEPGPSWDVSASLAEQSDSRNSAQFNSMDSSVGGTAMLGRAGTPLQRVSEASEVHEGMPAGLGSIAAGASNQSIISGDSRDRLRVHPVPSVTSHDSEHSDPFLQETQNEQ